MPSPLAASRKSRPAPPPRPPRPLMIARIGSLERVRATAGAFAVFVEGSVAQPTKNPAAEAASEEVLRNCRRETAEGFSERSGIWCFIRDLWNLMFGISLELGIWM